MPHVQRDGLSLYYEMEGSVRQPLVFIHGWCCDMTFWREQVPAFDGQIRIILLDLPGHGQSDKPQVEYTMGYFARSVNAVLKDAKVDSAILVGHSMGVPVARQFYRLYPNSARALVSVDGALRPAENEQCCEAPSKAFRDCAFDGEPAHADEENEADHPAEQAVNPFPEEDELEARKGHSSGTGDLAILGRLPVEIECALPVGVRQWRHGPTDGLPFGDGEAAFGQARDPADDHHRKYHGRHHG